MNGARPHVSKGSQTFLAKVVAQRTDGPLTLRTTPCFAIRLMAAVGMARSGRWIFTALEATEAPSGTLL